MKITILCCTSNLNPIYSVVNIVRTQCKYFMENGHDVSLLVNQDFDEVEIKSHFGNLEILNVLPKIEIYKTWDDKQALDNFINRLELILVQNLPVSDIIITHDFLTLPMYLPLNITVRKLSNTNPSTWLHWVHSKPEVKYFGLDNIKLVDEYPLKNSLIVYPNNSDKIEICDFFRISEKEFLKVYNTIDLDIYFKQTDRVKTILNKYTRKNDFIIVYPTRLNYSKRIDKLIDLTKFLKAKGLNPLVIICNSYNNAPAAESLLKYFLLSIRLNDIESNLLFTSELGFKNGLDNDEVNNLFKYSSFFVFPTLSETCPLVLLEAVANSNILILNKQLEALKEVAGEAAYYIDFDLNPHEWLEECYKVITTELRNNKIIIAKNNLFKYYTTKGVYDNINFNFHSQLD